ncbi:MAG: hypothetical protein E6176_13375 [Clostridium celatum]|nr:hypothetical protein [Clostridium celatum]
MGDYNRCKYCNVKLIEIDENEAVCESCGLLYKIHRSLRNDKVKYLALEWN